MMIKLYKLTKVSKQMKPITSPNGHSDYFSNLLRNLQQHNTQHQIYQLPLSPTQCIQHAYDSIICGILQLKPTSDSIQQIITLPSHKKLSGDINQIDEKIRQNEQMLKQAKRQMLIHKRQENEAVKLQHEIKMRQNQEKIRAWTEKQKVYNESRRKLIERRDNTIKEQDQKMREQRQIIKQQQEQQRKRTIQQRLKSLQKQRQHRQQQFTTSIEQTKRIRHPKFKQIEQQFSKVMAEQAFEKEIIKKNIKIAKQLNHQKINQHQKQYLEQVEERMRLKGEGRAMSINEGERQLQESQFRNLLKRSDQQVEEEREKLKRRMDYQMRIAEVQLNVDDTKKIAVEIARDKAQNPLKYNFLKQKQLNDHQIFLEFKDFALDIDRNELGKQYLMEAKRIGEESRIRKSQSVTTITLKQKEEKYKNYLPEIRQRKSLYDDRDGGSNIDGSKKSVQKMTGKSVNSTRGFEKISRSLKKYDQAIVSKKNELKSLNMISSTLKKEKEIDQMYVKSLKAKLACLQLQE